MSEHIPPREPLVKPDSRRNIIAAVVLLGLVVFGSGLMHVTYGGTIGCHVLVKEEWSLHDTFVDMEEIENMSVFEALASGHKGVIRALIRDEIIRNPLE
tara:strand:- start:13225 stop:13521 length:297 start_codon:yes stop_codon:yes gene_type:complete